MKESAKTAIIMLVFTFIYIVMFSLAGIYGPWSAGEMFEFALECLMIFLAVVVTGAYGAVLYRRIKW